MKNVWKKSFIAAVFFIFTYVAMNQSGSIADYVAYVKGGVARVSNAFLNSTEPIDPATLSAEHKKLYEGIAAEAQRRRIEPIDARVDPVWKAIPGLNGQEVDVERTFRLAVESEVGRGITYITREVAPKVSLSDLGAQPIYKGNPRKPMISLMINVAWGNEFIPGMLETLRKEHVKATFFLDGSWLKNNPDVAKTIMAEGHEMSNHAYSHKNMSKLGEEAAKQEIAKTQKLLKDVLGVNNKLFAPPSGDYDGDTVRIAYAMGLHTVLWTIDTVDWKKPPAQSVVRKIASRLEPGSLILMHPTESASGALPGIIAEAKRQGLAIAPVSDLLSPNRVKSVETLPGF